MNDVDKKLYLNNLISDTHSYIETLEDKIDTLNYYRNNLDSCLIGSGNCGDRVVIIAVGTMIATKYGDRGKVIEINHDYQTVRFVNADTNEVEWVGLDRIN